MILILKKYLVQIWWIPLLVFVLSIILLFTDAIFPNSGFTLFLTYLTGFILFVSCIWQFIIGNKLIALFQFSTLVVVIMIFGYIIYIISIMFDRPDSSLSETRIQSLIKNKTDFIIPKDYEVSKNLIHHTEGAFDSDYSIELTIKYQSSEEKYIVEQIINSELFDITKTQNYTDPIWTKINDNTEKGIWSKKENGFNFLHCDNDKNRSEPFYFEIDTLNNIIELNLSHL